MRWLSPFLAILISIPAMPGAIAQEAAPKLNLVIVEGEGAINNIRQRTAREPIVQVEDENHRPVAGAAVIFTLSGQGAGGTFTNGVHSLTVMTDGQGRAVARGFRPNRTEGRFEIHVTASHDGLTASAVITEMNIAGVAAGAAAGAGISGKLIAVIAIAAAAAAGGAIYATHNGGGGTAQPAVITPGTGAVGPPR
jgi:hypothetical protein